MEVRAAGRPRAGAAAMNSRWSADSSTNETMADSPRVPAANADRRGRRARMAARQPGPGAGSRSGQARERRPDRHAGARLGHAARACRARLASSGAELRCDLREGDADWLHAGSLQPRRLRRRVARVRPAVAVRACGAVAAVARPAGPARGRPRRHARCRGASVIWTPTAWVCSVRAVDGLREVAGDLVAAGHRRAARGSSLEQRSGLPSRSRSQQRVWKRQPDGGLTGRWARRPSG